MLHLCSLPIDVEHSAHDTVINKIRFLNIEITQNVARYFKTYGPDYSCTHNTAII